VAVDAAGNLFIADRDNNRVRRVDVATGVITTVAGGSDSGSWGDGGPAAGAALDHPSGVAVDAAGNLYIADTYNSRVRKVDAATGIISIVAGSVEVGVGLAGYGGDGGPATSALLNQPTGVAADAAGNLFIADEGNQRVRRVDAVTGIITTVAGTGTAGDGGDGGPAAGAALDHPSGVAVDAAGNLFIADYYNFRVRRLDAATGVITTVAGDGSYGFAGDGGPATAASLSLLYGVAVDAAGNLFLTDTSNFRVRRVDATTGVITTVAGNGDVGSWGDGGPATGASVTFPRAVAVDAAGNLFIAEPTKGLIRKVAADGVHAGDPLGYTVTIRNTSPAGTGPVTVTGVTDGAGHDLTDLARSFRGGADIVLAPGEAFTFNYTTPAGTAGQRIDTVTVTAHDDGGTTATASDTVTVTVH
jgi:sugar lactone lactonase YvrE